MSSVQEKQFLRLIKFSYDLSLKVTRTFTKANILHCHNNSFVDFLNFYKHDIYHLWNNNIRCCACSSNALLQQNRELNKDQFIKLYDPQGSTSPGHFKQGTGRSVVQHCLCGIRCRQSCSMNDLDIIIIHTLLRKCAKLSPDDDMWLRTVREIRNNLAHAVSTTCFDQGRLEKWWSKLEGSVLGLAGKVPPFDYYAESIEDQIKLLRKIDYQRNDVAEILDQIKADNQRLQKQVEEGLNFDKIFSKQEKLTDDVKQKSEEIKEEIIHRLDQNKEEIMIDIKNLIFEVKTHGVQRPAYPEKNTSQQRECEICYVEWSLKTPDEWQVELIKDKLNLLKSMIQGWFKIEFVYVGSLVIQTSVSAQVLADMSILISAIRSFLEEIVELCEIDTETTEHIQINLSVLQHLPEAVPEPTYAMCEQCRVQNKIVPGVNLCQDCMEILCIYCTTFHRSRRLTKNHKVVVIKSVYNKFTEALTKQLQCVIHDIQVEHFCTQHDDFCCRLCLTEDHQSCDKVVSLNSAFQNENVLPLENLEREIKDIDGFLEHLEAETQQNASDIIQQSKVIEQNIAEAKARAIDQINKQETILLSEVKQEKRIAVGNLQEILKSKQCIVEEVANYSRQTWFVKTHCKDKEGFVMTHHLKKSVDKLNETLSNITRSANTNKLEHEYIISSVPNLGIKIRSRKINLELYTPIGQKHAQCIVPQTEKPFKLTSEFPTSRDTYIPGMVVTKDDKVLLCNFTDKREVLVYNDNGHFLCAITMKHKPYDIAVIPGGDQCVVTLPDISSIQYINSNYLTKGLYTKLPTLYHIYGIAIDAQYVYVGGFETIFLLDIGWNVVREIQMESSGFITYLIVSDDNLYAADQYNGINCIKHEKMIKRVSVTNVGHIRKILLDRQGYIYVGGQVSGKIHQLDKDLTQKMTIGDDSVARIGAISFNTNCTKLFVASGRGKTIAVFSCT